MINSVNFEALYEIAEKFNRELECVPVLYGSLGLSRTLDVDLETDDIDLLIEEEIFTGSLTKIYQCMEELGFVLTNAAESEFTRGSAKVGIASDGDMLSFSGVDSKSLAVESGSGSAEFRVLSAEQYLSTYQASSLDGYRKNTKNKDDQSKIALIRSMLDG